jgi:hypothetical protein
MPKFGSPPRERPSHVNSLRRMSECTQDYIELRLELRDSSELDAQLPFSVAKPRLTVQGDAASAEPRRTASEAEFVEAEGNVSRRMADFSDHRERMPEVRMPAVLNRTPNRVVG